MGLYLRILAHADAERDREVCGLLFGGGGRILDAVPAANVHSDPARFFEIDPQLLFAAVREERSGGRRLIGHYHSHPSGGPSPSARDAASAEPGVLWLIIGGGEAGLWLFEPVGRFRPVALSIHE